jgi:hypothetical protein
MSFFCSKCGYCGENMAPHLAPKGSGKVCGYLPVELEPITEEQARELLRVYGYDLVKSGAKERVAESILCLEQTGCMGGRCPNLLPCPDHKKS